jgi:hypothetical protein
MGGAASVVFWTGWEGALVFVQPETVIRWHNAGRSGEAAYDMVHSVV